MRPVKPFPFPHLLPISADQFIALPILEMKERIEQWGKDSEIAFERVRRIYDSSRDSDPQAPPGCMIISTVELDELGKPHHVEDETMWIDNG